MNLRDVAFSALAALFVLSPVAPARAQEAPPAAASEDNAADDAAERRIREIFAEIDALQGVTVDVRAGVASLGGATPTVAASERAEALASAVPGVVTVENAIERDVSLPSRLAPALNEVETLTRETIRIAPLLGLAVVAFAIILFVGGLVARWGALWRRLTPNPFIAELAQATVRLVFFVLALVAALSLLDATPLLSAVLGAAGVLGLAVVFGLRDIIENYIASIMLSVRQPFRPDDHVAIDGREGRIARLTPRATILVTLDGNQLRIPNAAVFKAVIVNYTANPERRFDFELQVDAEKDVVAALKAGREALEALDFVLKRPAPAAVITKVDAKATISFSAWIDQRRADFAKSRSIAIAAVKKRLDAGGSVEPRAPAQADTKPEKDISRMVLEERHQAGAKDLLSATAQAE